MHNYQHFSSKKYQNKAIRIIIWNL